MSPKVLLRCDICGKFHAAYLVEEHGEKRRYCYNCWKGRQAALDRIAAVGITDQAKDNAADSAATPGSTDEGVRYGYDPDKPWENEPADQ